MEDYEQRNPLGCAHNNTNNNNGGTSNTDTSRANLLKVKCHLKRTAAAGACREALISWGQLTGCHYCKPANRFYRTIIHYLTENNSCSPTM